jgi:hypothetical protein
MAGANFNSKPDYKTRLLNRRTLPRRRNKRTPVNVLQIHADQRRSNISRRSDAGRGQCPQLDHRR